MTKQNTHFDRTLKLSYSPVEICELYDQNPNMTLQELSIITMRSVKELKRILQGASR
jgi:hypothetical protein